MAPLIMHPSSAVLCVCNLGFIVIVLKPSYEPSTHLRRHTLSPAISALVGPDFSIFTGELYSSLILLLLYINVSLVLPFIVL